MITFLVSWIMYGDHFVYYVFGLIFTPHTSRSTNHKNIRTTCNCMFMFNWMLEPNGRKKNIGVIFSIFSIIIFWTPLLTNFNFNNNWLIINFINIILSTNLTFFPQHSLDSTQKWTISTLKSGIGRGESIPVFFSRSLFLIFFFGITSFPNNILHFFKNVLTVFFS